MIKYLDEMEEGVGFEPTDVLPSPVFKTGVLSRSTNPPYKSAPERTRTHNLLIRSQTLYPIELRRNLSKLGSS